GGVSIAIPMSGYLALEAERKGTVAGGLGLLWFLGTAGIVYSSTRRHQQEMKILEDKVTAEDLCEKHRLLEITLREHTERLEVEIFERQLIQEQLEEQTVKLEEEAVERQQAVATLQKTEHFLQAVIDSEPECVKLLDSGGKLLMMNRAGLEMIGAGSFDQVNGQSVTPLVCEPFRSAFEELTALVFQGRSGSLEFEICA